VVAQLAPLLALAGCSARDAGSGSRQPSPRGCVTDVAPGAHTFTCEGLRTDLFVPTACPPGGCGLILELHGDTGTGLLIDANTALMSLAAAQGYLVVAPTGPERSDGLGPTWTLAEDDKLVAILGTVAGAFQTDARRRHLTGFSRGGYVTWRLLCEHADLFASVAPAAGGSSPGGGCDGVPEVSCPFDASLPGGTPSRPVPVLMLIGRTDVPVPWACAARVRDQAIAAWGLQGPQALDGDAGYAHARWSAAVAVGADGATGAGLIETFEHSYETAAAGPEAALKGHCVPGSTFDPYAPQYAIACAPPNAFRWGEEVLRFFVQHPEP
jgi:poly(3-hydroxybutyrate) depolymerase